MCHASLALSSVIDRPGNGGEALQAGDDRVVVPAGAVNGEQAAILVPAAHDPHITSHTAEGGQHRAQQAGVLHLLVVGGAAGTLHCHADVLLCHARGHQLRHLRSDLPLELLRGAGGAGGLRPGAVDPGGF